MVCRQHIAFRKPKVFGGISFHLEKNMNNVRRIKSKKECLKMKVSKKKKFLCWHLQVLFVVDIES